HTRFSRDWSSDVCSSDLGDSRHPGNLLSGDATRQQRDHIALLALAADPLFILLFSDRLKLDLQAQLVNPEQQILQQRRGDLLPEIGRASCRENAVVTEVD